APIAARQKEEISEGWNPMIHATHCPMHHPDIFRPPPRIWLPTDELWTPGKERKKRKRKAAFTFVQAASGHATANAVTTATFGSNNTSGNTLVAFLGWNNAAGISAPSFTDSQSNVRIGRSRINGLPMWGDAGYMIGCKAGANTVTVTLASAPVASGLMIAEYSSVSSFDTDGSNGGSGLTN